MATTGPFSFHQYYQNVNSPIVKEIWDSFIKHESIWTRIPTETVTSQKRKTKRIIGGLPTPTSVTIGSEPPNPFVQDIEDYEEGVFLFRDNFDIDRLFLKDTNYVEADPIATQMDAYLEGRAFYLNNVLINNHHTMGPIQDQNAIVGIKYRLADQTLRYGNAASVSVQSTADLSDTGMSGAGAIKLERDIERLFDLMGVHNGDGVLLIGSPQLLRQINAVVKTAGYQGGFKTTSDAFDREVVKFKGAEIVTSGYQAPAQNGVQSTPVIDSAQDVNGWSTGDALYNPSAASGGANFTTLYAIRRGKGLFSTWQMEDPWMKKVEVAGTRKWRVMFDMTTGLWQPNTRAIGRIYGIKVNGTAGD